MVCRGTAKVAALIPAAGRSSRMEGGAKLERTIDGVPMLRRAAIRAHRAGMQPLIVVGASGRASEILGDIPHRLVINESPERGLGYTLRLGVETLSGDVAGVTVLLPDMPHVTTSMLRRLAQLFARGTRPIVASRYGDLVAPPVIFARELFGELAGGEADSHGRSVIARDPGRVRLVSFPRWRGMDVDTRADLRRARAVVCRLRSPPATRHAQPARPQIAQMTQKRRCNSGTQE